MESNEKRLILFILISVAILLGSAYLFPAKKLVLDKIQTGGNVTDKPVTQNQPPVIPAAVPAAITADEKEITVETSLYKALLTTKGGGIKQWELKNYQENDRIENVK